MAAEDPISNASATPNLAEKNTGAWDWIWPVLLGAGMVKLFGALGGIVAVAAYFMLRPKIGTIGAVVVALVLAVASSVGIVMMLR